MEEVATGACATGDGEGAEARTIADAVENSQSRKLGLKSEPTTGLSARSQ